MRDAEQLIVVSDFHLGPGARSCMETFFNDEGFAAFIDDLLERAAAEEIRWRLVILGDFIDFLRIHTDLGGDNQESSEEAALACIERAIAGHPTVFEALARFLRDGCAVDVVVGNHDVELIRPRVQQRLCEALNGAGASTEQPAVRFHPWLYYRPGLLYAEHGNQHDDLNCFSTVLDPYARDGSGSIDQPVGSHLFQSVEGLLTGVDPCVDHASPLLRYYGLALRRRPELAKWALQAYYDVASDVVAHARRSSGAEWEERRAAYRDKVLEDYAATVGLSADLVRSLDAISSASRSPVRQLARRAVKGLSATMVPAVGAATTMWAALAPNRNRTTTTLGAAGAAVTALARRNGSSPTGRRATYLHKAAMKIHRRLEKSGDAVAFYVFGHTHGAEHLPLDVGPDAPQYLNSGTWSAIVSAGSDVLRTVRPTFVHITPARDGSSPVARVLAWNDASRSSETLRFQA